MKLLTKCKRDRSIRGWVIDDLLQWDRLSNSTLQSLAGSNCTIFHHCCTR